MRCYLCPRTITPTDAKKAVTIYLDPDGAEVLVGSMESVKTPPVGARLVRAAHHKCQRVAEKREGRGGDAVRGRSIIGTPTAYELADLARNRTELAAAGISVEEARTMTTRTLSERVQAAREASLGTGLAADDWRTKERLRAEAAGGPYEHRHVAPVPGKKLAAHLIYAHGLAEELVEITPVSAQESLHRRLHQEAEARTAIASHQAARHADPAWEDGEIGTSDWREQSVADVDATSLDEVLGRFE